MAGMSGEQMQGALSALFAKLDAHEDHTWQQVGRCVYCHDCGERLYQGTLPPERRQPKPRPVEPKATTAMRERWGKH
jgi:hypothetical protein